jgi:translation initiation factor IF-2
VPLAGEDVMVLGDERKAREIALFRQGKFRDVKLAKQQAPSSRTCSARWARTPSRRSRSSSRPTCRAATKGLSQALTKMSTDEVKVNIVHAAVGGITESDINLALASKAVVVGFNVRADAQARKLAEGSGVQIRYYNIIYDAVDDVKAALSGMLTPEQKENTSGSSRCARCTASRRSAPVAGCYVLEGPRAPRRARAPAARQRRRPRRRARLAQAASRTTCARSRPDSNAASRSRTTTTSEGRPASRCSRSSRSRGQL